MQRKLELLPDGGDFILVHLLVTNDDATQALSFSMRCVQQEFDHDQYSFKFSVDRHPHATLHTIDDVRRDCDCEYVKGGFCNWWEDVTFAKQMVREMCIVGSEIVFEHMEKYLKELT
jgi:hypothetical protein